MPQIILSDKVQTEQARLEAERVANARASFDDTVGQPLTLRGLREELETLRRRITVLEAKLNE